ncbi:MAG: undecaprenyl/decaprenyl-phosphate alpha-N-acetylglucosaminyl 1-phosphate transferase [Patescibacteria group bacterium]|nr:undecaprenyl/decaprenyl-phosphate alpha-N-acetylglucosaminyl 1-phosphate transferase [Patescibacteria group bacterium]
MILVIILSALFSSFFTLITIFLAKKINLVTDVTKRSHPAHTHSGKIPRGGGLPILLTLLIGSLLFLPINKIITGILISSLLLVFVGLLDDYFDISPYLRFILNILFSCLLVMFGLGIPFISNPLNPEGVVRLDEWRITIDLFGKREILILANLFSVIWLTWTTNMVNWSKGVDGQLPGFVAITAFFLGLLSQRFTAHDISAQTVANLAFITTGAYLGFLVFNIYPQKIMPGYGGGALAGFLLGVLSILSFGKLGTAILILSVPTIDAIYTILRRIKNKKSPFKADWGHFHHRLLEIGWGRRRIATFYWLVSLIFGIASLFLKGVEKLVAFVSIGIILLIFIYLIEQIKKIYQ